MRKKICLLMAAAMSLSFATVAAGCGGGEGEGLVVWTFTDELGEMVENYYKKKQGGAKDRDNKPAPPAPSAPPRRGCH